jgi:hypothetical protein
MARWGLGFVLVESKRRGRLVAKRVMAIRLNWHLAPSDTADLMDAKMVAK